jgi:adenylate cyclase
MPEGSSNPAPAGTRRLAAIMFTDIVGFSHQMGANEARMLRLLAAHNHLLRQAVTAHEGHVIKTMGDAFVVDFPSVINAVQCAQHVQAQFRAHNRDKEKTEQIHVRIGIHSGDIVVQPDGDVFGDGVNIASRLQTLAEPDTICISHKVYEEVAKKTALGPVISLGRPKLKNIAERFQVYALLSEPPTGFWQHLRVQRLKLSRRVGSAHRMGVVAVLGLILGAIVVLRSPSFLPLSTQDSALRTQTQLALPDKPSIVVLPFDNMSEDPKQDYFSNGITEVLTSDLSRISSLFVIARNTAFTYKGKAANIQEIGKELGVRYVLEGSVQKASDQVRIVAQLVDTTTDAHVWSERYDRPFTDIFALQDEIVQKIVTTLKLQLTLQEQGFIVRKTTDNLEAYDHYLRGLEYFYRYTKEANAQARQMFEKALALDPQYALAYASLSSTYRMEWDLRSDPQTLERAFELAQQAVALDDSLPAAHAVLGLVYARKQQSDQAIAEIERAIALDPNNADSYGMQAETLLFAGRPDEALRAMERAMRLNPRYPPWYLVDLGGAYLGTGRYAEATVTLKEHISRNPNLLSAHFLLATSYLIQWGFQLSADPQTLAQALAATQRGLALNDSSPWGHGLLGTVYLLQKQYEPALAEMERVIALAPNDAGGYAGLAEMLSRVGRSEEALGMVEQALRRNLSGDAYRSIGIAYYLAGRPEEAIAPLKQYRARYPNFLNAHLTLAAAYSELGREAEARAEGAEVLRLNPNFSLEVYKQRAPINDPAMLERQLAALRKAGLK